MPHLAAPLGSGAGADTVPLTFETLPHAGDTASGPTYSLLQSLTAARAQAAGAAADPERRLQWSETYLVLLRRLSEAEPALAAQARPAICHWRSQLTAPAASSAAAGGTSPRLFTSDRLFPLASLQEERVLATHLYAALLQQQAASELGCPAPAACTSPRAAVEGAGAAECGGDAAPKLRPRPLQRLKSLLSFRSRRGSVTGAAAAERQPASPASSYSAASLEPASRTASGASALAPPDSPGAEAGDGAGVYARAVALYRRAAGVYEHIAAHLLPAARAAAAEAPAGVAVESAVGEPGVAGPPVELWPGYAEALASVCLAQAQGVAAQRAAAKGTAPALAAALHQGAADMFQAAGTAAAGLEPPSPGCSYLLSDQLRRFLLASGEWQRAEAWRQAALHQRELGQGGAAVACMQAALQAGSQALTTCQAGDEHWRAALAADLACMERLSVALDRERSVVYNQKVAAVAPALPAARVIVTAAIPFDQPKELPEDVLPPV
ncbi:hypothetical protein ABPG75_004076 [Micractinium tetrahymenae]